MDDEFWEGLKKFNIEIPEDAVNVGGGFELINRNRHLYPNPMKDPEIAHRNIFSRIRNQTEDGKARLADVSRQNLKKAVEVNTGKKRPEHGKLMSAHFKRLWVEKGEQWRNSLASTFEVVSPDGQVYNTNRLEEFCKERGLTYVPIWNTSRTGKPVTKGISKGWLCKKI